MLNILSLLCLYWVRLPQWSTSSDPCSSQGCSSHLLFHFHCNSSDHEEDARAHTSMRVQTERYCNSGGSRIVKTGWAPAAARGRCGSVCSLSNDRAACAFNHLGSKHTAVSPTNQTRDVPVLVLINVDGSRVLVPEDETETEETSHVKPLDLSVL